MSIEVKPYSREPITFALTEAGAAYSLATATNVSVKRRLLSGEDVDAITSTALPLVVVIVPGAGGTVTFYPPANYWAQGISASGYLYLTVTTATGQSYDFPVSLGEQYRITA